MPWQCRLLHVDRTSSDRVFRRTIRAQLAHLLCSASVQLNVHDRICLQLVALGLGCDDCVDFGHAVAGRPY